MFPAVKKHLLSFGIERLEQTGKTHIVNGEKVKARKKTSNKWFETQDSISYWEDFFKPKIFYPDITQNLSFCKCDDVMFCNNTTYFMTATKKSFPAHLMEYLNSKLIDWYYRTLSVQLGEKAVRMFSIYVLRIPIPKIIHGTIYQTYGLTPDEQNYIEHID